MVLRPSEGECKCLVITVILIMSFHDLPHSLAISFQSTIAPPLLGLPFQFRVGLHFPCSDDVPLETRPVRNSEFLRQYDPIFIYGRKMASVLDVRYRPQSYTGETISPSKDRIPKPDVPSLSSQFKEVGST